jgi:hypothetical protein
MLAYDRLTGGAVGAQARIEVGPDVLWRLVGACGVFVAVRLVPVGQIFMVPVPPLTVRFRSSIPERPELWVPSSSSPQIYFFLGRLIKDSGSW